MKKSNIFVVLFLLLSSSCTAQEKTELSKLEEKDFSYLKMQTVLLPEDKKYYERIHNEISEIGKHFAYREENAMEKYCPVLEKMFDEISIRPFSKERERERERERESLQMICNKTEGKYYYNLTKKDINYLNQFIQSSSVLLLLNQSVDLKDLEKRKIIITSILNKDTADLISWKKYSSKKKEYCEKAVKQMQWDHMYYLTEVHSPEDIIQCLDEKNEYHYLCECPEAMELAVKGWSKKALYDPMFINPDAEEVGAEYRKQVERELRDAILKATGRDLNKEPKVYYYEGDPGR